MVEMKLFLQICQTINILCAMSIMIFQLKLPSYPYVLVNRSVLCNCGIEAKNNFLLESLAACHDAESKPVMCFMVNTAFVNYLDNLTESLTFPILLNRTTHELTLPILLQSFKFDSDLLKAPKTLKHFVHQVMA